MEFLQKIIDFLRGKPADAQIGGRQEYWKSVGMRNHAGEIETLVLGSSHAQCAYNPGPNEFNLGLPAQDLYYSWALYNKYAPAMKQLKRVVLFYSIPSPGFELERTRGKFRCFHYEVFFGVPWKNEEYRRPVARHCKWIERKFRKFSRREQVSPSYVGENILEYADSRPQTAQEIADGVVTQVKNNRRPNHQTAFVERLYDTLTAENRKLIVVLPPWRADYRGTLPPKEELFRELFELAERKPLKICDLFDGAGLASEDFRDPDHLNASGAQKVTALVRDCF